MQTYAISGMTCASCVRHVTEAIQSVSGVTGVLVDLDSATAQVQGEASFDSIKAAVVEEGYDISA
ncbi:MAG TPA: heavy metal transport/detoxification protein [Actinobacteria bacterium]|nr:heavy metal transport/detoxification protein [Actinomycetota bacterium]